MLVPRGGAQRHINWNPMIITVNHLAAKKVCTYIDAHIGGTNSASSGKFRLAHVVLLRRRRRLATFFFFHFFPEVGTRARSLVKFRHQKAQK